MNIRILLPAALSLVFCSTVFSADARARLLGKDGSDEDVFIIEYKNNTVFHRASASDLNKQKAPMSGLAGIYFYEPNAYSVAMSLYKERKFKEAKKAFAKCEANFKSTDSAKGNYSTLAGFYKLECSRRMLDLKALNDEQSQLRQASLVNQAHKEQLELNALWETIRLKQWQKSADLAAEWEAKEVSNSKLAQVAYCHALALEKLGLKDPAQIQKAIAAYNRVMVVDHTLSIELVVSAAEKLLNIYSKDLKVKKAMKSWGTKDENKNSQGYSKLIAANALVQNYNLGGFEKFKALSAEHAGLIKFTPKGAKSDAKPAKAKAKK